MMITTFNVVSVVVFAVLPSVFAVPLSGGWNTGGCTYHDYEGDKARLGRAYDNSPGWCGIRYSALDVSRVVAIGGMNTGECAQCIEFQSASGTGPSIYVLAIDEKVAGGLDVARSSFQDAFPGSNPLDPQSCSWRFVDPAHCAGVCFGSSLECTPGQRNLLPADQLPPVGSPEPGKHTTPSSGGSTSTPTSSPSTTASGPTGLSSDSRQSTPASSQSTPTSTPSSTDTSEPTLATESDSPPPPPSSSTTITDTIDTAPTGDVAAAAAASVPDAIHGGDDTALFPAQGFVSSAHRSHIPIHASLTHTVTISIGIICVVLMICGLY